MHSVICLQNNEDILRERGFYCVTLVTGVPQTILQVSKQKTINCFSKKTQLFLDFLTKHDPEKIKHFYWNIFKEKLELKHERVVSAARKSV